jgi:hypothetical protein
MMMLAKVGLKGEPIELRQFACKDPRYRVLVQASRSSFLSVRFLSVVGYNVFVVNLF